MPGVEDWPKLLRRAQKNVKKAMAGLQRTSIDISAVSPFRGLACLEQIQASREGGTIFANFQLAALHLAMIRHTAHDLEMDLVSQAVISDYH